MDIEISPTDVIRAATAIDTVAAGLNKDSMPAGAGDPGFTLSDAIARFSAMTGSPSGHLVCESRDPEGGEITLLVKMAVDAWVDVPS